MENKIYNHVKQGLKANELADKAINNPDLLVLMDDETMLKFAIGVALHNREKAIMLMNLKYPKSKPATIVTFWQAIGIIEEPQLFI
jgi:hypothetical protein